MPRPPLPLWLLAVVLVGTCAGAAAAPPLLTADFSRDPLAQGWQLRARGTGPFDGGWIDGASAERCLVVRQGYWQSPPLPVKPFGYYRLRFTSQSECNGFWAAVFYDTDDHELVADNYDSVFASTDGTGQTACFRAHALAERVRVRFQADQKPLWIAKADLEEVDSQTVAKWADALAADGPALRYRPSAGRWQCLPHTMATLRQGGRLRIVMLGDSICNDLSNSMFETLLHRVYPRARIEVISSVRGGTGCQFYKNDRHVTEYVLRFKPDLVIIAGISHGYDVESIRSVIQQIRTESPCEILVLNEAVCPAEKIEHGYLKSCPLPAEKARENLDQFTPRLQQMTAEERVEFLDLRGTWDQYLRQSSQPNEWFHRDPIHANSRGKQVMGHILSRYLAPELGNSQY